MYKLAWQRFLQTNIHSRQCDVSFGMHIPKIISKLLLLVGCVPNVSSRRVRRWIIAVLITLWRLIRRWVKRPWLGVHTDHQISVDQPVLLLKAIHYNRFTEFLFGSWYTTAICEWYRVAPKLFWWPCFTPVLNNDDFQH